MCIKIPHSVPPAFPSSRPNLFVGNVANSSLYSKWYYEVSLDFVEEASHMPLHFRVGWGCNKGYVPYPGGGEKWGGNGVGDDLFSFGFDGANLWTGGRNTPVTPAAAAPGTEGFAAVGKWDL